PPSEPRETWRFRHETTRTRGGTTGAMGRGGVIALGVLCIALAAAPAGASAHRPGPDILYAPPPAAPQLENTGVWQAPPILVSGASAYRDGEFLYQDYLYDDSGAAGNPVENDPRFQGNTFSRPTGTYVYPTNTAKYANNAADIVELRIK